MRCLLIRVFRTGNEANFRTSAYEALASYVTHAAPTSITVVQNTALTILSRMEQLLAMQVRQLLHRLEINLIYTFA